MFKGILPAAGGLALLAAFVLSIKSYWPAASSYSSFEGIGGIAVLTIALADGVGIPLALGDPELTPAGATADVMAALAELLRLQPG